MEEQENESGIVGLVIFTAILPVILILILMGFGLAALLVLVLTI